MSDTNQSLQDNPAHTEHVNKTILIVEDDRTHRALMDKILKSCGFQTVQAENGLIALSKIESGEHFDLILMDWDMPKLDGLATVKKIREREVKEGHSHAPVIAFTGNRAPGDREKCLAAGMDAYLPKDVWLPKWRSTLVGNLQGLVAGDFELADFENHLTDPAKPKQHFTLDEFDEQALEQAALLLKEELPIAIEEYLEDAALYIQAIEDGLDQGDAKQAATGSHPLKSNSRSFGLTSVADISETINTITRKGECKPAQPLLVQLKNAFEKAEEKLRKVIKNLES